MYNYISDIKDSHRGCSSPNFLQLKTAETPKLIIESKSIGTQTDLETGILTLKTNKSRQRGRQAFSRVS